MRTSGVESGDSTTSAARVSVVEMMEDYADALNSINVAHPRPAMLCCVCCSDCRLLSDWFSFWMAWHIAASEPQDRHS